MTRLVAWALVLLACGACHVRPRPNPHILVVALSTGPNTLDPRVGLDDTSQKIGELIFDNLFELDDRLRVTPKLAERLDHPTATTYIVSLRKGVRFHDGHELTAGDVVHTFRSFLDPDFVSSRKGGYRELQSVEPLDRYSVLFTLSRPFASFPINLIMPIVPDGAGAELAQNPVGTGPYRFIRQAVDDFVELAPFEGYHGGPPANAGLILKVVPDDIMRGLELRKGTTDLVVNDLTPDIAFQLERDHQLRMTEAAGLDYQYIGLNLLDPVLQDVRVRQALVHAIDRGSIIQYLRRGLARAATGLLPQQSWASISDLEPFSYDPPRARLLLDEAGYHDPDGDGPAMRVHLVLKISSALEFNRLQAAVIQQNLRDVGVELDVRTFEFATLFSDVLSGNFQMYTLQWTAGSLADPDILRRVFHSEQVPPLGFNRGHYSNPDVDRLLDEASASSDETRRLELFHAAQRAIARDVPYISLWNKTNFVLAQPSLDGVHVSALADFTFLKDVKRMSD